MHLLRFDPGGMSAGEGKEHSVSRWQERGGDARSHFFNGAANWNGALWLMPIYIDYFARNAERVAVPLSKHEFDRQPLPIVHTKAKDLRAFCMRLVEAGSRVH